jgi:hypothetical protein
MEERSLMIAILLLILFFAVQPLAAQSVEDQLREMRAEIQRLRHELDDVKQQLQASPDKAEEVTLLQAQVQEHAQTKIETSSRFPMKVFGTIVSNTFWNSGDVNWLDIPNVATAANPALRPGSFNSTLRQSRIGATMEGPEVGGMKVNGALFLDFFGGIPNFQTGQLMGLPRLLYGYVRLDGETTAFEIGQDHVMLAPRNPTSLAGRSFPVLYRAGNLYLRAPQIRAERVLAAGEAAEFRAAGGIVAPVAGDFGGPASSYQFAPPNLAGERSRMPAFQTRLAWRATQAGPYEQPQWEFGLSGHYGHERYATGVVPSWAAAADFDANSGKLGLGGEVFVGRNLDAFGGAVAQIAKSYGGFVEGRLAATSRLSFNSGYGTDRLFHITKFPAATYSRNGALFANTTYQFTPEFAAALEYQRLVTKPVTDTSRRNNHFNLTFAYSF